MARKFQSIVCDSRNLHIERTQDSAVGVFILWLNNSLHICRVRTWHLERTTSKKTKQNEQWPEGARWTIPRADAIQEFSWISSVRKGGFSRMQEAFSVGPRRTCITDVAKLDLEWRLPPKEETTLENVKHFLNE